MLARSCFLALPILASVSALASDLSNNLDNTSTSTETAGASRRIAASFRTDGSTHTLTSVTLLVANRAAGAARLALHADGSLEPGSELALLTPPASFTSVLSPARFRAPSVPLTPNTIYWLVLSSTAGQYDWAWSSDNSGAGAGFQLTWALSDDAGAFWWSHDTYPLQLAVTVDEIVCRADFNTDNFVNSQDFFDFLTAFFASESRADFNADTVVNSQDFFDFVSAFFAGC